MVGKVDYDETKVADITAWVPGRLDRLYVDYTGVRVRKGDHLVLIYSPELIVAQDELLEAIEVGQASSDGIDRERPRLDGSQSAEKKLRLLGLLPEQIEEIKRRGKADRPTDDLRADRRHRHPQAGQRGDVRPDRHARSTRSPTCRVVWVHLEAYESDLAWLRYGQTVDVHHGSLSGQDVPRPRRVHRPGAGREDANRQGPRQRAQPRTGSSSRACSSAPWSAAGWRPTAACSTRRWPASGSARCTPKSSRTAPGQVRHLRHGPGAGRNAGLRRRRRTTPEKPLVIPATAPLITGKRAVVYVAAARPRAADLRGPRDRARPAGRRLLHRPRRACAKASRSSRTAISRSTAPCRSRPSRA